MTNLTDDVRALVHLYGRVPKGTIIHILNQLTEGGMDEETLDRQIDREQLEAYKIDIINDHYVLQHFLEMDYSEEELRNKEQHPYYMPLGYDLEYYRDERYFEPNDAFDQLHEFLKTCYVRKKKAEKVAHGIQFHCRAAKRLEQLPSYLSQQRLKLKPEEKDSFRQLIFNLVQQTRMYDFNGHTPNELGWKLELDMNL
ncbi:hypothetical protein JNUCC1_01139 [Lentibacillus sp. JNUCC-1]|uniref:hypothetical protein n=1 Tax=Lentibacillus sp. JNUCC-1 TaxID=2654513 RepID=UPI0012E88B43|nr:hypothetical protein [Lentibacillus sp. JNUCC-1]MUV37333.1 hypothetical protein [Lentibacillus sp. JNUCC-1]